MKRIKYSIYRSILFSTIPGIRHGYSTRLYGDMRNELNRYNFIRSLQLNPSQLVYQEQVHGIAIKVLSHKKNSPYIRSVDGMVYKKETGMNNNFPVLSVHIGDCVPMLFVDPVSSIIAVAHAGWKGTLGCIARNVVDVMRQLGSQPENIYVSMGPHIGSCCYNVPTERILQFRHMFGNISEYAIQSRNKWYLDLGKCNEDQLLLEGIKREHIDNCGICTKCNKDMFFSYRRDLASDFGHTIGVIAFSD